jgi:hypothetical protein
MLKRKLEVIQAVYEESGHLCTPSTAKKLDMNVLYININIDVDHKDILDIAKNWINFQVYQT